MVTRYSWLGNLVFVAICAYLAADSVNTVVAGELASIPTAITSSSAGRNPRDRRSGDRNLDALSNRNLLAAKREVLNPPAKVDTVDSQTDQLGKGDLPPNDEMEECSLPGTLVAIIAAEDPAWSIAVYKNKKNRSTEVYAILEGRNQLEGDASLVAIRHKEIVIRRTDHFELCELGKVYKKKYTPRTAGRKSPGRSSSSSRVRLGQGIRKVGDMQYEVDKEELDKVLGNLSTVATQARIVPNFKNGKANGFKMFSIRPGSIYSKLGMKNGDVIQKINGYEMNSPDKALEIYQKLRDSSSITVDLVRRGKPKSMNISIK